VLGRSTFRKLVPLLAGLVAASATLVAFRSAGGGGNCITAYRSPPINGKDATCQPDVTIGGVMLWNFEGLLYRSLGDLPALRRANEQSPDFVTGMQVCPTCTFYSYTFTNHTNSAFKLVTQDPRFRPTPRRSASSESKAGTSSVTRDASGSSCGIPTHSTSD
jgi:hypothetical protein